MKISKNYILIICLILYGILGSWLSINTGISHDEYHEQLNWETNLKAIKLFLTTGDYQSLIQYKDRYHGIAFHIISQPIQYIFSNFVSDLNNVSSYGGYLIAKHIAIFLTYSVSGIFFYLICIGISKSFNFSSLSTIIYLIYPYLFGHAQINPKDIPFLSFWIINTYFFLLILENLYDSKQVKIKSLIILSFFTAFLISMRTLGILIFIEYLIGIIVLLNYKKIDFSIFYKIFIKLVLIFLILFLIFLYLLNPIFWHNPLEFINSIKWMAKYQQDVCTLTLGDCMRSLSLPSSYYFIWLFFKLPILIIFGYLLFPVIEKKITSNKDQFKSISYLTILISPIVIILTFIFKGVAVYDEIRHIMFILPMIFIVSLFNIYLFNFRFFYLCALPVVLFLMLENLSINPYQYTWMNSFAKLKNIEKNFEIDYWGISNKKLQQKIINHSNKNNVNKSSCVYGDLYTKEFLVNKKFLCFKNYGLLDAAITRPFYAYKNVRNVKRSNPKDCSLIWNEHYMYTFYSKKISVGTLWFCN